MSLWVVVCAAASSVGVWLLLGTPRVGVLVARRRDGPRRSRRVGWVVGGLVGLAGAVNIAGGAWAAFIIAGAELAATVGWLASRGALERRALANERLVVRACDMIAGQLEAGEIPNQALLTTAEDVPLLAPAAGAVRVGGDVPAEIGRLSSEPGCAGLAWLAQGWQLSEATGMPLSPAARHVADTLSSLGDVRAQRNAELATARATSKLLAGLPVVGVGMGFLVDANPLAFLAGGLAGHLCLVGASTLVCAGLIWTAHLSRTGP